MEFCDLCHLNIIKDCLNVPALDISALSGYLRIFSVCVQLLHQGCQFCLTSLNFNSPSIYNTIAYYCFNRRSAPPPMNQPTERVKQVRVIQYQVKRETLVMFPPSLLSSLWSMLPLPSLSIACKIHIWQMPSQCWGILDRVPV